MVLLKINGKGAHGKIRLETPIKINKNSKLGLFGITYKLKDNIETGYRLIVADYPINIEHRDDFLFFKNTCMLTLIFDNDESQEITISMGYHSIEELNNYIALITRNKNDVKFIFNVKNKKIFINSNVPFYMDAIISETMGYNFPREDNQVFDIMKIYRSDEFTEKVRAPDHEVEFIKQPGKFINIREECNIIIDQKSINIPKNMHSLKKINNVLQSNTDGFIELTILKNDKVSILTNKQIIMDDKLLAFLGFKNHQTFTDENGVVEVHCDIIDSSLSSHELLPHIHSEEELLYVFTYSRESPMFIPNHVLYIPISRGIIHEINIHLMTNNRKYFNEFEEFTIYLNLEFYS